MIAGNDSALRSSGRINYNEQFSFDHGKITQAYALTPFRRPFAICISVSPLPPPLEFSRTLLPYAFSWDRLKLSISSSTQPRPVFLGRLLLSYFISFRRHTVKLSYRDVVLCCASTIVTVDQIMNITPTYIATSGTDAKWTNEQSYCIQLVQKVSDHSWCVFFDAPAERDISLMKDNFDLHPHISS